MYGHSDVCCIPKFFTNKEIETFCLKNEVLADVDWQNAEVTGKQPYDPSVRKTKVKTIDPTKDDSFLLKMMYGVIETNDNKFKKKIQTYLLEPFNLLKYGVDGSFFKKHNDALDVKFFDGFVRRQLTAIAILSDTTEYVGGGLVFYGNVVGSGRFRLQTDKGSLIVFPSDMYHEVTPVTAGTRLSLVMWAG